MAILEKLQRLLDLRGINYQVHPHPEAFTAKALARAEHVGPDHVTKVVVTCSGDQMQMVLVPASRRIDMRALRHALGAREVHLADEGEINDIFSQCETGAVPPFGGFWDIPVWMDETLSRNREMIFAGGNHHETVHMNYSDFEQLVHPRHAHFSQAYDL